MEQWSSYLSALGGSTNPSLGIMLRWNVRKKRQWRMIQDEDVRILVQFCLWPLTKGWADVCSADFNVILNFNLGYRLRYHLLLGISWRSFQSLNSTVSYSKNVLIYGSFDEQVTQDVQVLGNGIDSNGCYRGAVASSMVPFSTVLPG